MRAAARQLARLGRWLVDAVFAVDLEAMSGGNWRRHRPGRPS